MLTGYTKKRTQDVPADEHENKFMGYVAQLEDLHKRCSQTEPGLILGKKIESLKLAWHVEHDNSFVWRALLKNIKDYIPIYDEIAAEIEGEIIRTVTNERKAKPTV